MKKSVVVLALLVLGMAGRCRASISEHGSCGAATTSCTLSAVSTNDLKLVFAIAIGSSCSVALPSGFTSIVSTTGGSGGTKICYEAYCSIASSSSDTGSGTATGASEIVAASYTGTNGSTTANCATSGSATGANANTNSSSATMSYPALTLANGSGSSWVVGLGANGGSAAACVPTGLTSRSTGGTGPATVVADTNAGVTSFAALTCSITSARWATVTVEVLQKVTCFPTLAVMHVGACS